MQTVLMNRLSWPEYRERTLQGGAPVLLPVGATEQHGPHLPLGTDALLASAVAEGVAHKVGGVVAPAFAYGFKSQPKCGGGQHFTGTTSLDAATLIATVRDTVREFHRHGVRKLIVVNGHYENQWFLIEGIDLAMRELGAGVRPARDAHGVLGLLYARHARQGFPRRLPRLRAGACRGDRDLDDAPLPPRSSAPRCDPRSRTCRLPALRHVSHPHGVGAAFRGAVLGAGPRARRAARWPKS